MRKKSMHNWKDKTAKKHMQTDIFKVISSPKREKNNRRPLAIIYINFLLAMICWSFLKSET